MRKVIAMANVPLDGMRKAPRHLIGTPEAGSPTAAGRCQLGTPTGLQQRSLRARCAGGKAASATVARKVPLLTRAVLPARPGRCETNQS